jgi:hypothetical protein
LSKSSGAGLKISFSSTISGYGIGVFEEAVFSRFRIFSFELLLISVLKKESLFAETFLKFI